MAAAGDAGSEAAPKAKARAKAKAAAGDDGSHEAEPTWAELEAEVVVESNTSSRTLIGGGIP
jgi:hypothetical protein